MNLNVFPQSNQQKNTCANHSGFRARFRSGAAAASPKLFPETADPQFCPGRSAPATRSAGDGLSRISHRETGVLSLAFAGQLISLLPDEKKF
jgi:hypothetical protein